MGICKSIFASPQQPKNKREVRTAVDAQNVVRPSNVEVKLPLEPTSPGGKGGKGVENEQQSSKHIRQDKRSYADIARGGASEGRNHIMGQSSRWAKHNVAYGNKVWYVLNCIFVERLSFVRSMKRQRNAPTVAQLITFLSNLENQILHALHDNVDPSVLESLQHEFNTSVHWDWSRNKPVKNSFVPTPRFVESFLEKLVRISSQRHRIVRNNLSHSTNFDPTDAELNSLDDACSRLWLFEEKSRLKPGRDYAINLQNGKKPYQVGDRAADNLFTYVKPDVLERQTFKRFRALLDNYSCQTGIAEVVTTQEVSEEKDFLDACFETPIWQYVYRYVVKKKKFKGSIVRFQQYIHDLWFGLYKREVRGDSSAFEHVFVGEIRDNNTLGMHNWIQLYNEELKKRLNYLGFIKPKGMPRGYDSPLTHSDSRLITIQFEWNGALKPISTSFIGTTPEFELGIYSLIYLCGNEGDNIVELGPYRLNLVCHKFGKGKYAHIGTVYPEALPMDVDSAAIRVQSVYRGRRMRQNRR